MTRDDYFRFRTDSSGLTDDALILFDWYARMALLGCWAPPLYAEDAAFHLNLSFQPHTWEDRALEQQLARWQAAGLFECKPSEVEEDEGRFLYFLTPSGAALWSAERLPVWERYYEISQYFEAYPDRPKRPRAKHGEELFVITSPNRRMASGYLRSAIRCGYLYPIQRHRTYRIKQWPTEDFPWPRFRNAWQLRVRVKPDSPSRPFDHARFYQEKQGWSDPTDLIALRLNGTVRESGREGGWSADSGLGAHRGGGRCSSPR